jgi:chromate transporter
LFSHRFFMVVALGAVYTAYGGLGWMQAVFYGVGAAVIGIITMSAYKLTTKNIGRDKLLWLIFFVSAVVTVVTQSEIVWLFLGAGVLVWLVRAPPKRGSATTLRATAAPLLVSMSLDAVDWHSWRRSAPTSRMRAASCSAAAWPSCPSCTAAW